MKPDKKTRLVKFLDRRAFDPVLKISPQEIKDESARKKLQHVQQNIEEEKNRYHTQYQSPEEVRRAFFDDLNSNAAKQIDDELKELRLPSRLNLKGEFLDLCEKLDV
jgi:hypothetical protein